MTPDTKKFVLIETSIFFIILVSLIIYLFYINSLPVDDETRINSKNILIALVILYPLYILIRFIILGIRTIKQKEN